MIENFGRTVGNTPARHLYLQRPESNWTKVKNVTRAEIVQQRQNEGASDERKREMKQLDVSSVFQCAYVLARNYHYHGYCSRFHVYAWLVPSFMTVNPPPPNNGDRSSVSGLVTELSLNAGTR